MIGGEALLLWWIALVALVVVSLVVAGLLYWLHVTAGRIEALVGDVWQAGQRVANNTVHIPQLYRIAERVEAILARASRILEHAGAIDAHAAACPGCPRCLFRR
jgi:hypothetical protein